MTYQVGPDTFTSFFAAVASAKAQNVSVIEIATGLARWTPAPAQPAKKVVRHVLVKSDGTTVEMGRVRQ